MAEARRDKRMGKRWAALLLGCLWLILSLISLNHILNVVPVPYLSVTAIGVLGWGVISVTLIILSRRFWRSALTVFVLFFSFGVWFGPFLEPPADPLEHLRRTQSYCDTQVDQLPTNNKGFWHYSMSGIFLCSDQEHVQPDNMLRRINVLHGTYLGVLCVGLFILGKSCGMPSRWAFFSCLISFLFFGTNRFSYFSYYSLAPTFSSLLLYWLWTAIFFFRKDFPALVGGVLFALLLIPILWVNHMQEVFLLCFLLSCWVLLNLHERIWQLSRSKRQREQGVIHNGPGSAGEKQREPGRSNAMTLRGFYLFSLVIIFFLLPQLESFRNFLATFFPRNLWDHNQHIVVHWMGFHLFGRVWEFRVNDSFTSIGLLVVLLALPFFYPNWIRKHNAVKVRVFVLALLPFIGYFIPLFHFTWLSLVEGREYYRLCYATMFWLFFAYFFWGVEARCILAARKIGRRLMA
ncbi:MAG: hypothetical protein K9K37_01100 [Desulfocapsa sp.]|nr:hypothetical protein [Desulfocapsa sp.]